MSVLQIVRQISLMSCGNAKAAEAEWRSYFSVGLKVVLFLNDRERSGDAAVRVADGRTAQIHSILNVGCCPAWSQPHLSRY